MKKCVACKVEKEYSNFHKRSASKDGYRNDCKSCVSDRHFNWYNQKRVGNPYKRYASKHTENDTEKQCRVCLKILPLSSFNYRKKQGYREACCLSCRKYRNYKLSLKNVYNISLDQYLKIKNKHDGRCYICNEKETNKRHSLDHDHNCCPGIYSCGKCIRGILCHRCNTTLGFIKEDINTLNKMISYLSKKSF
jgi:hypothetical protein